MRLREKFKHEFKRHLLTAFLSLIVMEIFNNRFQPIAPTIMALLIGSLVLGVFFFIGDCFVDYLVNGVFNGFKYLLSGQQKENRDR